MPKKRLSYEELNSQEAKAKERAQSAQRKLKRVQAQKRKAAQKATEERRLRWAAIAERVGLFELDDDTLQEVLTIACAILQKQGDYLPFNDTGIEELNGVDMLILTDEDGTPLREKTRHAASVEGAGEKANAMTLIPLCDKGGPVSDVETLERR
jgi:hypothetical protein